MNSLPSLWLISFLLLVFPQQAYMAEIPPLQIIQRDQARHPASIVRFDGVHFRFTPWPVAEGLTDQVFDATEVFELRFRSASDLEHPLWRFAPEGWEAYRGRLEIDGAALWVHGATGLAHPLPEDLPRRFQFDLRLLAPPEGLSAFQWQVLNTLPNQVSPNSFTLSIFGESLVLQPAGVQAAPAAFRRQQQHLPATGQIRLQLFHDQETGECILLANGERKFTWNLGWTRNFAFTGIRYQWADATQPRMGVRSFEIRPWPPHTPETIHLPENNNKDQLLLQNGDVITGTVLGIGESVHFRMAGEGPEILLPLHRVFRIRFAAKGAP